MSCTSPDICWYWTSIVVSLVVKVEIELVDLSSERILRGDGC